MLRSKAYPETNEYWKNLLEQCKSPDENKRIKKRMEVNVEIKTTKEIFEDTSEDSQIEPAVDKNKKWVALDDLKKELMIH